MSEKKPDFEVAKDYYKDNRSAMTWLFVKGLIALVVIVLGFTVVGMITGTIRGTASVIRTELGPQALNQKYEWFKNTYAALDAKKASIAVFDNDMDSIKDLYGDNASNWPRDVRSDAMLSRNEVKAMRASYNRLAAEYNSEMAKWHTEFVNVGKLPAGGNGEIPRDVARYEMP